MQALEGWHSLQLTVIHLWEGAEDTSVGGSRPGPVQRGPSLGWGGQRDPWGQHSCYQWERWFLKARGRVVQSCGDGAGTPPAAPLPAPPPAWLFPEGPVPTCWPPPHSPSAPFSGPRSQGPANLQGVVVFVLVLQGPGGVSGGPKQLAPPVYLLVMLVLEGRGGVSLGRVRVGFFCPTPSWAAQGYALFPEAEPPSPQLCWT